MNVIVISTYYISNFLHQLAAQASCFMVFFFCIVMINIDLSETAQKAHWKSERIYETIFFVTKIFSKNFFPDKTYFSWTEFCRRLDFVSNFFSDYRLQLYFICKHFITYVMNKDLNYRNLVIT